jgi:hypothetical protein
MSQLNNRIDPNLNPLYLHEEPRLIKRKNASRSGAANRQRYLLFKSTRSSKVESVLHIRIYLYIYNDSWNELFIIGWRSLREFPPPGPKEVPIRENERGFWRHLCAGRGIHIYMLAWIYLPCSMWVSCIDGHIIFRMVEMWCGLLDTILIKLVRMALILLSHLLRSSALTSYAP